jgi:DME family drug/metabolite transporter
MLPVLAVVAAAMLFGTTGTAQALGPPDSTPLGVGAVRIAVGGAALAAVGFALASAMRRRATTADRQRRPHVTVRTFALMGLTGICLAAYQPLFFLGTARNGVAVGTVIALGSAPVLAGALETLLTRRSPGPLLPLSDLSWALTPRGTAMAAWLGFATVAIAYTLFTWGLRAVSASTAATLTLTEPLMATVLGVTVLSERLSAGSITGLAMLLSGITLVAWSAGRDARAASAGQGNAGSARGEPVRREREPRRRTPPRPPHDR